MSEKTTIKGTVIHVGEIQTFASGFSKAICVVKTEGEYPQEIPLEFVKDKATAMTQKLELGDEIEVAYNIRGNEYNGKWYVNLQGWRFDVIESGGVDNTADSGNDDADNEVF